MPTVQSSNSLFGTFTSVLRNKYVEFGGRSRRAEFWKFSLANFLVAMAILAAAFGLANVSGSLGKAGFGFYGLFVLAMFLPGLAVAVRRLHDTGKSGWYLLVGIIPLIGFILLLVFYFADSSPEQNRYGPSPKYA
jgi:uncharacterized membrane protein YhaH (DUF805 family)